MTKYTDFSSPEKENTMLKSLDHQLRKLEGDLDDRILQAANPQKDDDNRGPDMLGWALIFIGGISAAVVIVVTAWVVL